LYYNEYINRERKETKMTKVQNSFGVEFDLYLIYMDDDLREELHAEGFETEQEFFDAYCEAHEKRFGEEWELAKENPVF
jgi:hypothetical protein